MNSQPITTDQPLDDWSGWDATLRQVMTPIAILGSLVYAVLAVSRALQGEKLGGYGSLLILFVVVAMGAKLAAETYLFSYLGGDPSPRSRSARRMIGPPLVVLTRVRYVFGALGGVVLPLGAQILSGGAKNIPPASDAGPSAVCAVLGCFCLIIGELAERRLFRRAMDPSLDSADKT